MQRRTGKGAAHIAPPLPPSRMGSLSEKPISRLNQKSLGVTNRIWLILVAFLALILLTRSILPTESSTSRHRLVHTDGKPRNYLNVTEGDPVPFSFCPALGPNDPLASKYDPIQLAKTRLHIGSGARVQRVITRALSGHPVTISVVGGSSKSHSLMRYFTSYFHHLSLPPTATRRVSVLFIHSPTNCFVYSFCVPWSRRRTSVSVLLSFAFLQLVEQCLPPSCI